MRKTLTTFVVATALTESAFAVSVQEQTTSETGEMMQNDGAMQGGMMDGDMDAGAWSCGMVAGLIDDVPSCKELIDRIMSEADALINQRLSAMVNA